LAQRFQLFYHVPVSKRTLITLHINLTIPFWHFITRSAGRGSKYYPLSIATLINSVLKLYLRGSQSAEKLTRSGSLVGSIFRQCAQEDTLPCLSLFKCTEKISSN